MNELDVLARLGLVLARPAALILASPVMGGVYSPTTVRIGLAVVLALTQVTVVTLPPVPDLPTLVTVMLHEVIIGTALAMSVRVLIAAAELGGQLSGAQMMLSYGSMVDPQSGVRNGVLATLYANLTIFVFFLINGHHALMRMVAESYRTLPMGTGSVSGAAVTSIIEMLGVVFVLGLRLAAPLIVVLLIVEFASGLLTRSAPSLDLMSLSTPVRLLAGLTAVSAVIPVFPGLVQRFVTVTTELGLQLAGAFR
jgi:flagellar biosynthetic protein FliR